MKMIMCMTVMCLAIQGLSSTPQGWLEIYLDSHFPEQDVERLREDFKDMKKLRECMVGLVGSPPLSATCERAEEFKRRFGVSDKAMETVLIDIINTAGVKNGWKKRQGPDDPLDGTADHQLTWGFMWLGFCAETEGKKLLMGVATNSVMDGEFRSSAIAAYMTRADAQEVRDALPRFLADGTLRPSFDIYLCAMWHYDKVKDNPQKREAILSAVSAALTNEEEKKAFAEADKKLAEHNKEYAESPQRKAALERMNKPPENPTP